MNAATNTINILTEYAKAWGTTNWRVNAECVFVLPEDYTPNSANTGFRMKLTVEGHAYVWRYMLVLTVMMLTRCNAEAGLQLQT